MRWLFSWRNRDALPSQRRCVRPQLEQLEDRLVLAAVWIPQGPGPILQGAPLGMDPQGNPDVGSVSALLPDPLNPNILYAGTTNGGIWKTTNATASVPAWTPLTDNLPSLAIGDLAFSPLDADTLFAATGNFGSGHFIPTFFVPGGQPAGVLKSTDGGQTWSVLGREALSGHHLRQILPTSVTTPQGQVILAAAGGSIAQRVGSGGVFRSADGGRTWTELTGSPGSGLPAGDVEALIEDPANPGVLYTAVIGKGIFQSADVGQTWRRIDDGGANRIPAAVVTRSINIKLALNGDGTLFMLTSEESVPGELGSAGISHVYYTTDQGQNWMGMDVLSDAAGRPISEDGYGQLLLGLAADPTNPNVVYVTGSAAPSGPNLPDAGIVYRGDITQPSGQQWAVVVGPGATGTPPGGRGNHPTVPHSDSKDLVFDAAGNLLLGNDGGIYRLVNPDGPAPTDRYWVSVNGTLEDTEFYTVAYNAIDRTLVGGSQDNGMAIQPQPGQAAWNQGFFDDVTTVAVDNLGPQAVVYGIGIEFNLFYGEFSTQPNSLTLARMANVPGGAQWSGLNTADFDTDEATVPFALNAVAANQLLFGYNGLYESADRGNVIRELTLPGRNVEGVVTAIAYGGFADGVANSGVAYVGNDAGQVFVRTTAGGPFTLVHTFDPPPVAPPQLPPKGVIPDPRFTPVLNIALDPHDWRTAYAVVNNSHLNSEIWQTTDAGLTWTDVTGDLPQMASQVGSVVVVHPTPQTTALVVGGLGTGLGAPGSVFATVGPINGAATSWQLLGSGLPNVMTAQVVYNEADDLLVAGTYGRGAWTLHQATQAIRELSLPPTPAPPAPAAPPAPPVQVFALGTGRGSKPQVRVFNAATGGLLFRFLAYPRRFAGGVRVALADLNRDGVADIITAPGAGAAPHVKVFDGRTGALLAGFLAFRSSFRDGLSLTVGDLNRDGVADIVVGAGSGGQVRAFDGRTFARLLAIQAYPRGFAGGVNVEVAARVGDGTPNIVVRSPRGKRIKVFDGMTGVLITSLAVNAGAEKVEAK